MQDIKALSAQWPAARDDLQKCWSFKIKGSLRLKSASSCLPPAQLIPLIIQPETHCRTGDRDQVLEQKSESGNPETRITGSMSDLASNLDVGFQVKPDDFGLAERWDGSCA